MIIDQMVADDSCRRHDSRLQAGERAKYVPKSPGRTRPVGRSHVDRRCVEEGKESLGSVRYHLIK